MRQLVIEVVNKSKYDLPDYQTTGAAAVDIKANIDKPIQILGKDCVVVGTGLFVAIPEGFCLRLGGRSGLAFKNAVEIHRGILDSDYRHEIGIKVYNLSNKPVLINPGDRICQMYVQEVIKIVWNPVESLSPANSNRLGGLGSTGM